MVMLDPWQREVLEHDGLNKDEKRHLLLVTGRQVGKTFIFSRKCAKRMLERPGSRIIVVSNTEDQAQLIIIMILDYLEKHHRNEIAKGRKKPTKSRIHLKNGSNVISRPVGITGDAIRGFTGDVLVIDEAAMMPERMWASALPTLASTGGEIWVCSTPKGKTGQFYEFYLNKHNHFKIIETNTMKVYSERPISAEWTEQRKRLALQHVEERRESMSKLEFGQEYEGKFTEDIMTLYPEELIQRSMDLFPDDTPRINPYGNYYLGVDIARLGEDDSTFMVFELKGDHLYHRESVITRKTYLSETAQLIKELDRKYNFQKIYLDSEGIGVGVFDILIVDDDMKWRVEGLKNSTKIIEHRTGKKKKMLKEELYLHVKALMEKGKIHFLKDPRVYESLKATQYEYKSSKEGNIFMYIFQSTHAKSHVVEGIIRAAHATNSKDLNIPISSFRI